MEGNEGGMRGRELEKEKGGEGGGGLLHWLWGVDAPGRVKKMLRSFHIQLIGAHCRQNGHSKRDDISLIISTLLANT